MDNILRIENKRSYVEFVNQFSIIAQNYLDACDRQESVVVDFQNNDQIDVECSKNLFGRLLIDERLPFVLCRNISTRPEVVSAMFQGISRSFERAFPNGIHYEGRHIILPQIEMYDPSGDRIYSIVKLSDDEYAAIRH